MLQMMPLETLEASLAEGLDLLKLGGPVVAAIVLLSILAVTVTLLKIGQFTVRRVGRSYKVDPILTTWESGNRRQAIRLAESRSNGSAMLLARAMSALSNGASAASVREDVERLASRDLAELRSSLRILEVIAQIAPLLGLFGTVLGMIEAFQKLQAAGNNVDPGLLAGGIWVALLTTAAGLALAIPTSMVLVWLESRIAREHQIMEDVLTALFTARPAEAGFAIEPRTQAWTDQERMSAV